MIIPIKKIILEASKLDKVANSYIKKREPNKALNLYEKQNAGFNRNFKISLETRASNLKDNTTNMAGSLANYNDSLNDSQKKELIDVYKNNSRQVKKYGLDNPSDKKLNNQDKRNISNTTEMDYAGPSYITRPGYKVKNIPFNHGGGKHFIEDFLKNKNTGYNLEDNKGSGIQVHPFPNINTRADRSYTGYPETSVNYYGDRPATLTGRIDGKHLTGAPVKEEAGISSKNTKHIKNPKIEELNIRKFSDRYKTNAIDYALSNSIPVEYFLNEVLPNNIELRKQLKRQR